jgi:hypothetical protein
MVTRPNPLLPGKLGAMHLVALVSDDADLQHALRGFRDGAERFLLHPVPAGGMAELLRGLARLDFAGALVIDESRQAEAQRLADRSSLDAQELAAADTLTVTPGGIMADLAFGRAVSAMLAGQRWDAAGASVVVLGAGTSAAAVAREVASLGAASIAILASDRVAAERALPRTAAGTEVLARASADPLGTALLERADLVVRFDDDVAIPDDLLGPHLTLVDLAPVAVSGLRKRAMSLGALTFNRRDVEAYRLELGLSQVLGGPVGVEPILALFHTL